MSCITTQRKGIVNLLRELIPYCSIRNNGLCFFFSYFVKEKYLHDSMISILDNPRLALYIYPSQPDSKMPNHYESIFHSFLELLTAPLLSLRRLLCILTLYMCISVHVYFGIT